MVLVLVFGWSVIFLSVIRAMMSFSLMVEASKRLHDSMTKGVLRAKVEFFDTNPSYSTENNETSLISSLIYD